MRTYIIKKLFIALTLCACIGYSNPAFATLCESNLSLTPVLTAEIAAIEGVVAATEVEIGAFAKGAIGTLRVKVYSVLLEKMRKAITARFSWFGENLTTTKKPDKNGKGGKESALKGMTAQLNSGTQQKDAMIGASIDASMLNSAARKSQLEKYNARKKYRPNERACKVDTVAKYANRSREVSKALATGYSKDFNSIGNNNAKSKAGSGPYSLHKNRWKAYKETFCDPKSNRGGAGCDTQEEKETTNLHIMPSKALFGKDTIDLSDKDISNGIDELMFNITGYETAGSITLSEQDKQRGLSVVQKRREYLAQMDAVGSLVYSIVSERAPGKDAPEVQAMRQKNGITYASKNPSSYEIRQAIVEDMRSPALYKSLNEDAATITQKEVYLKAYSLVLLYDLIAKQEKISNAYAIETANMLENTTQVLR